MIFTWLNLINIILLAQLYYAVGRNPVRKAANLRDWKVAESLSEDYPYIVALLNRTKKYMCTGIIVNSETVLTSGSCIDPALYYIAVASAVLSKSINNKSLFEIASTRLHGDYTFELNPTDPNVTRMHSNIGLVFSVFPKLENYVPRADLGNYFASELKDKNVIVVGYGKLKGSDIVVMQHQTYHQTPCTNPKWYYCICGYEYSGLTNTYEEEFGKGAPVFLGYELIGVAATPSGSLELPAEGPKYNIFTVIGPYLPWIEKKQPNTTKLIRFRSSNTGHKESAVHCVYILFMISTVIN